MVTGRASAPSIDVLHILICAVLQCEYEQQLNDQIQSPTSRDWTPSTPGQPRTQRLDLKTRTRKTICCVSRCCLDVIETGVVAWGF